MTTRLLLTALLSTLPGVAYAGTAQVLSSAPMVADGQGELIVLVHVPGLSAGDSLKIKPFDGELLDARVAGPELLELRLRPAERYQADALRVNLKIRGGIKLTEDVLIPLTSPARGHLEVTTAPEAWQVGERGTVAVTVTPQGHHPLSPEAQDIALRASEGRLSEVTRQADGSFTATWTPPSKRSDPAIVAFTALDLSAPGEVVGLGTLALTLEAESRIQAPAGSQNVLVIGEQQLGPLTAPDSGELRFTALLDPRDPTITLQSVDDVGQRSNSELPLGFDAPSPVLLAPLPARLPAGQRLVIWAAALQADGSAWSGAAPVLEGYGQGHVEGKGLFSWDVTTPTEPGPWTLKVSTDEGEDTLSATIMRTLPAVQLSADPPTLGKDTRDVAVTANIKGPDGQALTGLRPSFTAEGATASGSVKDNGDGTYTQRYRVTSSAEQATVRVTLDPGGTGLPVARIVAWPAQLALPADGSSKVTLTVVTVDAYGLPVANQDIALTAPMGDGSVPPSARSGADGVAVISYRAGSQVGPAVVFFEASGVVGELVLWQHAPDAEPPRPSLTGDALTREDTARWQAARPTLRLVRVGAGVGPPAALTLATVPEYTTPGAAVLVQVKVFDASGKAVLGVPPNVTASVGVVGAATDNGDGSYNVPVQLPPGVDGPLSLTVKAGAAQGSAAMPTLASMGGPAALAEGGAPQGGGRDSGGRGADGQGSGGRDSGGRGADGQGGRPPKEGSTVAVGEQRLRLRVSLADTWFDHSAASDGDASAPQLSQISKPLPFGVPTFGLDLVAHPTGGPFGIDLRARGGAYRYALGAGAAEEVIIDPVYAAALSARFSPGVGNTVRPYVGLGVGVTDALVFTFGDDAKATAAPQDTLVPGAQLSAGLTIDTPKVDVSIELAELFGPTPSMSHAGLLFDLDVLPGAAALSFGVEADVQHLTVTLEDDTEVAVRGLRGAALVGLTVIK